MNLFLIGNSFSGNATAYLPQLASEGGHELHIGRAEVGGCSLQRHWEHIEAAERGDAEGGFYDGKSLRQLMAESVWDIVSIQQVSYLSPDVSSYRPYARLLYDYVRELAPNAEIVMHQTWAYRSDSSYFGEVGEGRTGESPREMWEKSRAAYHEIAAELNVRLIPTGDAFAALDMDEEWRYRVDSDFDYENPGHPHLPDQNRSLQVGHFWSEQLTFEADYNHASVAGCYLGALVWYGFLFGESPENITFAPAEIGEDFAERLRVAASRTLR